MSPLYTFLLSLFTLSGLWYLHKSYPLYLAIVIEDPSDLETKIDKIQATVAAQWHASELNLRPPKNYHLTVLFMNHSKKKAQTPYYQ